MLPDVNRIMLDQIVKGSPARQPIVVVIDDDPAVCSSLQFSLELEGFAVRTYGDAAEVLRAGDLTPCDCFVIDQRMPGMSGMELIEALRRRQVLVPAILVVSQPNAGVSARAASAAVPVVEKPLLGNALIECIRKACGLA
jgi:two-component system, LuxR family, response regulator FixJ